MRDFTDSYCERCGTRYTFGPTPSKGPSLAGARVLAKGLKNFVMNDEASLDEAMASARMDVERGQTTRIAEEFHRTFNFCMTCRQYACDQCWNPNQGACISCAPLWDREPIAPEDPPIVLTQIAQRTLGGAAPTILPTANAGGGDISAEVVPWPSEDLLPGRPAPRRSGKHASEPTTTVPEFAQPAPATQPAQSPALEPQPETELSPAREPQAAQESQAQSQSRESRDDAWTLWPTTEEAERAELTSDELTLVQAQLSHSSPREEQDLRAEASSPSRTLDEDAVRLVAHEPGPRTDPETLARATSEPEAPAPQMIPSSDFALLGSFADPAESSEPSASVKPHRAPAIGRLLRRRTPIAGPAQEQAPKGQLVFEAPKPAEASAPGSNGGADSWPQPTLWAQRPTKRHDSWAEAAEASLEEAEAISDAPVDAIEAAEASRPEPAAEVEKLASAGPSPAVAEPESTLTAGADEPVPAARASDTTPAPAIPAQRPLVTTPPAIVDRWRAIGHEDMWVIPASPAKPRPSEPAPVASQAADAPAPWPPIGAGWPTQSAAASAWPGPEPALVSASAAAARQAQQAESPLVAAIWAESAQKVLTRGNVRVCHRCALPVSTHARFCRRCGTQQT